MTTPIRRRRPQRPREEVETALLNVARELFDEQGFQATTTMEISKRADVSERLIFSKFGNKAGLFNAAVLEPFVEVVVAYVDAWLNDPRATTPEQRFDYLVNGLYDLARKHRKALITALAENINGASVQQSMFNKLARSIQRMVTVPHDYRGLDVPAMVGALVGMVFGAALLDDLIYPQGMRRPGRRRLINEMRAMLIGGIQYRA
ncbi:MAG TPA: TetR/AcrR family transcriptional regulator [Pseudonocardia sp.]